MSSIYRAILWVLEIVWEWLNSPGGQAAIQAIEKEKPMALFDGRILHRIFNGVPSTPVTPAAPGSPSVPASPVADPHPILSELELILSNPSIINSIVAIVPGGAVALPFVMAVSNVLQALQKLQVSPPAAPTAVLQLTPAAPSAPAKAA